MFMSWPKGTVGFGDLGFFGGCFNEFCLLVFWGFVLFCCFLLFFFNLANLHKHQRIKHTFFKILEVQITMMFSMF